MLARYYFDGDEVGLGSFNIAVQDGPEAGQTVAHVHVHVIPRIRGSTAKDAETPSDELYDRMADEDGNVGGAQWDFHHHQLKQQQQQEQRGGRDQGEKQRPEPGGKFPSIEDCERVARSMEEMEAEAKVYRRVLEEMDAEKEEDGGRS
ncbi:hypothetical protein B0H66DRAFT_557359 [Apodospora peruviana]|uniref:HIT domain-containing protein n=1 Tax=Apodospora peruviana TaxID=516989 RepID=A0AAE0M429_9PEZI|nr:hypothetical protein B0H66DRAFT_557359 [Apodospora peruviana]